MVRERAVWIRRLWRLTGKAWLGFCLHELGVRALGRGDSTALRLLRWTIPLAEFCSTFFFLLTAILEQ